DVDGAADRVAPEECSLGSSEDLDPVDVGQLEEGADSAGDIDAIDVEADARVDGGDKICLTHSANQHGGVGCRASRAGRFLIDEIRHDLRELIRAIDPAGR